MAESDAGREATPLAVLDALWEALKENYPAMEYVGAFDDAWRDEFRARLGAVPGLPEAFPVLEELVNRFHDYHTGLHWPGKPAVASPPVRLGRVEDRIAVVESDDPAVLAPGDLLLHVDETEAEALYRKWLAVARGATPFARRQWACDRLLEGAPDTRVGVCFYRPAAGEKEASGERSDTVSLVRTGRRRAAADRLPVVEAREAAPDAGYIRIPRWWEKDGEDLVGHFDAALDGFRDTPLLVLDVRGNGGGSDELADRVTGRFLRAPVVSSISFHRTPATQTYRKTVEIARPRGPWRYAGRVAVLTDEDCCSACEHFVSGMNASGEVLLVGRPTTGACGWSKPIALPGGATLYCSMTFPFHGLDPSPLHGIPPHRLVLPSLAALRANRDPVLETALRELRAGAAPAAASAAAPR